MQMSIPTEIIWLVALLGASAVLLVWIGRDGWRSEGRLQFWVLVEDLIAYFLFMGMFIASTLQIVIRYGLADVITLPWTEEFSRLFMIWAALWGAGAVQRRDEHINMTVVYDFLPEGARRWVRVIGDVVLLVAMAPVVWLGWETARSLDIMYTIALGLPLSVFAYPIPVGGALMMLHTLHLLVRRVRQQPVPTSRAPES